MRYPVAQSLVRPRYLVLGQGTESYLAAAKIANMQAVTIRLDLRLNLCLFSNLEPKDQLIMTT